MKNWKNCASCFRIINTLEERGKVVRDFTLDTFVTHYIIALFWSETDDDDQPLDEVSSTDDLDSDSYMEIRQDCEKFVTENRALLEQLPYDFDRAGHDFALTRNGHGTGFWDRDTGEIGDILTEKCDEYGHCNLYIGDDGKVYC